MPKQLTAEQVSRIRNILNRKIEKSSIAHERLMEAFGRASSDAQRELANRIQGETDSGKSYTALRDAFCEHFDISKE